VVSNIHDVYPKLRLLAVQADSIHSATGESDEPVMNYASNAQQEDVLGVLREFIARTAKEFGKKL